MSSEQMLVLRMLSDGRIDVPQAERLLELLTVRRKPRQLEEPAFAAGHRLSDESLGCVPVYGMLVQM